MLFLDPIKHYNGLDVNKKLLNTCKTMNKNIHLLPTDKPSKLFYNVGGALLLRNYENHNGVGIYITNDEEIKNDEYYLGNDNIYCLVTTVNFNGKKIILTTDQDLIKNGIQAIGDDFLEWFVKNPSCENIEIVTEYKDGYGNWFKYDKEFWDKHKNKPKFNIKYKIIIPQEEPKQERVCNCGLKESEHNVRHPFIPKQETLEEAELACLTKLIEIVKKIKIKNK